MSLYGGLVSVTFRQLSPVEIIALVAKAGLACIEWGGDLHVPHGNLEQARLVAAQTRDAGLRVSAYGSYYRVWPVEPAPFGQVLETALALGAPVIRVWAGKVGSDQVDESHWRQMIDQARAIGALAAQAGIDLAFEYHANTLTDRSETALRLVREVGMANVGSYWQPPVGLEESQALEGLDMILPWLRSLHIFAWRPALIPGTPAERLPLSEGASAWQRYFALAAGSGRAHDALLEFVRNDSPEAFLADAVVLKRLLDEANRAKR